MIKDWNIEELTGYKPITSLYRDFSIAEKYGEKAIKDTYNKAFNEYKDEYKYLTELVMVLNWKIYEHYKSNELLAKLYNKLWEDTDLYATNNLKNEEEQEYYFSVTD